jgi:hypothetical protein
MREEIRRELIEVSGGAIPITLEKETDPDGESYVYNVFIDGVFWCSALTLMHSSVLFSVLRDHVSEYMNYTAF